MADERGVEIGPAEQLIPGPAVPSGVEVLKANNNLDAVSHGGRRYLAWRTAPHHFASGEACVHVIATDEADPATERAGSAWDHETTLSFGRDVREPRFFSWGDRLFLYCFTLGTNPLKFEPDRIQVCELTPAGWTDPEPISPPDCVVWRVRLLAGRPVMAVYRGAGTLYTSDPEPLAVELWTSADGYQWESLDPQHPVSHLGGSETEVIESPGGGWLAVTRIEGPDGGWGSDVCRSPEGTPGDWERRSTARKLDSPLLFEHDGEVYLLARRQRGFGGRYDLGLDALPRVLRTRLYQGVYWLTPKATALYRIGADSLTVDWIADLPGRGDTAFPALVSEDADSYTVYNYSSPLDGWDRPWLAGQLGPTNIYAFTLSFLDSKTRS